MPVTSAGPAMKPLVPLSRQIRVTDDGGADDQPPVTAPFPQQRHPDSAIQPVQARFSTGLLPDQFQADGQPRDVRRHAARGSLGARRRRGQPHRQR